MESKMFLPLVQTSLTQPRAAARLIVDMALSREILWTALALVAILNTFLVLLIIGTSGSTMPLPGYFNSPLALFILIAGLTVVYVHTMYWSGLAIGGKGSLLDVLSVVVWFQVLRALAQIAVIILSVLMPAFGALLSLVIAVWGLWIFLNFLTSALNLNSPWHALAVLILAFLGLVVGLGILLSLLGGMAQGLLT